MQVGSLENVLLTYSILKPDGILLLKPSAPLSKEDFASLGTEVDAYLCANTALHGVMIQSKTFPGWESFGGFIAHMHFVRDHHTQVERIAVVTDSPLGGLAEVLGNHFASAVFKHFPFADHTEALDWLRAV